MGGAKNVKSERLRNDVVDMIFAAFGTYFDGIMTSDKKVRLIHDEASYLIKEFFSHL